MTQMLTRNSYASGHFELRIDGHKSTAYVKSVEGGWSRANIVDDAHGPDPQRVKQISSVDIDPISIEVTAENAEINAIDRERLALAVAEGVDHPLYDELAPFDLVIANILAQPLIELAPSITATMAPGGTLILAGLLDTQAEAVTAAYRREGMRLADTIRNGDWTILMLRKRRRAR